MEGTFKAVQFFDCYFDFQMMLKNLTNNAKNLAANAKIEDMTQLFKSTVGKQDVKHALSGVMDISKEVIFKSTDKSAQ